MEGIAPHMLLPLKMERGLRDWPVRGEDWHWRGDRQGDGLRERLSRSYRVRDKIPAGCNSSIQFERGSQRHL